MYMIKSFIILLAATSLFSGSAFARFVTPDPLFLENPEHCVKSPTECNLYSYAKNNPVNNVDPSGMAAEDAFANRYDQLVLAGKIDRANAMIRGRAEAVVTAMGTLEDFRPLPDLLTLGGFAPLREGAQSVVRAFGRRAVGEAAELGLSATRPASSIVQSARLRNSLTAKEISSGHAFEKHVIQKGEFPGVTSKDQFSARIESFLNDPNTVSKSLSNGRSAYCNDTFGDVLIRNPKAADGGTYFKPDAGRLYFEKDLK